MGEGSVHVIGTGSYAPEHVLTNADLEKMVDTSDEWITTRTGIKQRHIVAPGQATSDMAYEASLKALEEAGIDATAIDLIVVGTASPDMLFPSAACLLQNKLGATNAFCMDLNAACSGFIYALETARKYLQSGTYKHALVVGADTISTFVNWEDRTTCVLFGDGAGAAVLRGHGDPAYGILDTVLGSDGSVNELLMIPAGGSLKPPSAETIANKEQTIVMSGREVFKHAVNNMSRAALQVLQNCGLEKEDVKWVIPHQANARIINAIGQKLGLDDRQVFMNVHKYGNTSAASIGLALDEAVRDGLVEKGDLILFVAFGAGFTWGAMAVRWGTT